MASTTQETPAPPQTPDRKLGPPDTIVWRWSDDPVEETSSANLQTQARLTALVRNTFFSTGERGGVDVVVVPTAPTHFTRAEMEAGPIGKNSFLSTFTHGGNVLDLCSVACPAGEYDVGKLGLGKEVVEEGRLPFGVTFWGLSGGDAEVHEIARRFEEVVGRE
ncbi:hypothetical protein GE09DRAFT_1218207 [Coniochaeta sp. 2T2.1]|nr:hypothetical protein GE09DRAFT_1218207 [Coniochaeta sp. 2T2.1]